MALQSPGFTNHGNFQAVTNSQNQTLIALGAVLKFIIAYIRDYFLAYGVST